MEPLADATGDLVLRLARAVAKHGATAMLIDPNNKRAGWASIEHAAASGGAFAIAPRDGVLVCDVDGPEHLAWASAVATRAREVGCNVIRVGSGRADHEHVWLNGPVGWSTDDLRELARDAGGPGAQLRRNQVTRPPLSPHRSGLPVRLIDPMAAEDALRLLERPARSVDLTEDTLRLIRGGDPDGKFQRLGTPSGTVLTQAIITGWINAGRPYEELEIELRKPHNAGGEKFRSLGDALGQAWLRSLWTKQREYVRDNPPIPTSSREMEELDRVVKTADGPFWTGRAGTTDRRVFRALVDICVGNIQDQAGRLYRPEVACSQRRLSELTGFSRKTVARSLQRLRASGFVSAKPPNETATSAWKLHSKVAPTTPVDTHSSRGANRLTTGVTDSIFSRLAQSAFHGGGLPPGALDTIRAMPVEEWIKTSDIRAAHPGSPTLATVRSHLAKLHATGSVDHDLARKQYWKRSAKAESVLERCARRWGMDERASQRRDIHAAERTIYHARFGTPARRALKAS